MKVKNPRTKKGESPEAFIFVISGPSGSGKTTLLEKLLEDRSTGNLLERSVSFTTRPKRRGEIDGRDYFFISREDFVRNKSEQKILEWTKYLGYYYGTPGDFVESRLAAGKSVVLCLDTEGAKNIKARFPRETITIFIAPPSLGALQQRIKGRRRETEDREINQRLGLAKGELGQAGRYDHCIVNDDLGRAEKQLRGIVLKYIKKHRSGEGKRARNKNGIHGIGRAFKEEHGVDL